MIVVQQLLDTPGRGSAGSWRGEHAARPRADEGAGELVALSGPVVCQPNRDVDGDDVRERPDLGDVVDDLDLERAVLAVANAGLSGFASVGFHHSPHTELLSQNEKVRSDSTVSTARLALAVLVITAVIVSFGCGGAHGSTFAHISPSSPTLQPSGSFVLEAHCLFPMQGVEWSASDFE